MRRRFVQVNGELIEVGIHAPIARTEIVGEIEPYKSMITGEMITSRTQHREHLKKHGCREIGNEVQAHLKAYDNLPDVAPQQRKELIRAQFDAMTHKQFKAAVKKDIDRVKWNSRER